MKSFLFILMFFGLTGFSLNAAELTVASDQISVPQLTMDTLTRSERQIYKKYRYASPEKLLRTKQKLQHSFKRADQKKNAEKMAALQKEMAIIDMVLNPTQKP